MSYSIIYFQHLGQFRQLAALKLRKDGSPKPNDSILWGLSELFCNVKNVKAIRELNSEVKQAGSLYTI